MIKIYKSFSKSIIAQGLKWGLLSILLTACTIKPEATIPKDKSLFPSYQIGTRSFVLEDTTRVDPDYGANRLINIQVWYPADLSDGTFYPLAPYYLGLEKAYSTLNHWSELEYQQVALIASKAFHNAPILPPTEERRPLVLFSPSLGGNLSQYAYYAEYLSQKGYIVVGVNHQYESEFVINQKDHIIPANHFIHDSLRTLDIPQQITADEYRLAKGPRQKILGEDLIFCLNQMELNAQLELKNQVDWEKVGVFGHSIGGAAAVYASLLDERFKAVLNIDGTPPSIALEQGMNVPFMFIEDLVDYENHVGYGKLHLRRNSLCEKNSRDAFRIMLAGTNHNSFLDIHYNLATLPAERTNALKVISTTATYMESFFNAYLADKALDLKPQKSDTLEVHIY